MPPARRRATPSPATTKFVEGFWRSWDAAVFRVKELGLMAPKTCRCSPQWPSLEAEQDGQVTPVEPSEYPIGWPATT